MPASTIYAMKGAFIDRLKARAGLAGVTVSWSVPTEAPGPDWILVDKAIGNQEAAALGQQRREEEYTLHTYVTVRRPFSDDPRTVADRAFALASQIEDELRDDVTVNETVRVAQVSGVDLEEWADGGERGADVTVRVNVRARI